MDRVQGYTLCIQRIYPDLDIESAYLNKVWSSFRSWFPHEGT
jgi:hypothetical protein